VSGRPRVRLLAGLLAAAVTLLAGCSSAPRAAAARTPAATLGFAGKTLDGKAFDASTMAGKPAILWFWAPWCATCAQEAQSISDLAVDYRGKIGILGIAGMGDNKQMHQFVSDLDVGDVPNLDDQAGTLWRKFGITQQSTYIFVDRTGKIVKTGYLDDLALTTEVKKLTA
jgi:thiol-disulfide isomerase/thioredoxin